MSPETKTSNYQETHRKLVVQGRIVVDLSWLSTFASLLPPENSASNMFGRVCLCVSVCSGHALTFESIDL